MLKCRKNVVGKPELHCRYFIFFVGCILSFICIFDFYIYMLYSSAYEIYFLLSAYLLCILSLQNRHQAPLSFTKVASDKRRIQVTKKNILWLLKWKIKKTLPRPTFWCYESRLQTILASLVKKDPYISWPFIKPCVQNKYIYLDTFHCIELLTRMFAG